MLDVAKTIDDNSVLPEAQITAGFYSPIHITGVNGVNHVFEVDRFFYLAVSGSSGVRRTTPDVGGVSIVANDADLNFIRAIVAVPR